jgi:hypothetical protein
MTNLQSRGSLRAAFQAGAWQRPVQGFTLRFLPLVLAVAAAGCDRTRAVGQEVPHPSSEVAAVSATTPSQLARGALGGEGTVTVSSVPAPGAPAVRPDPPRPVQVAALPAPEAPANVAEAGTSAEAVAADLPAEELPDAAAPSGTTPLLVSGADREILPGTFELGGGELDGLVLAPGSYAWSSGLSIPAEVTLAGEADDVWVFRVARDLVVAERASVLLTGGARAGNVLWLVAGRVTLGAGAIVEGTIESPVSVSRGPGAVVTGGEGPAPDQATLHGVVAKQP